MSHTLPPHVQKVVDEFSFMLPPEDEFERAFDGFVAAIDRVLAQFDERSVIDELTYRSYAFNRQDSPKTTPQQWAKIFGPTEAMERRYQKELIAAMPDPEPADWRDEEGVTDSDTAREMFRDQGIR